jgi:hypothetical protein
LGVKNSDTESAPFRLKWLFSIRYEKRLGSSVEKIPTLRRSGQPSGAAVGEHRRREGGQQGSEISNPRCKNFRQFHIVLRFIRMVRSYSSVMPGLVPGIHGSWHHLHLHFVDGRNKSGHDRVGNLVFASNH